MIDEEWLRGLQFDSPNGRITGLAGIGSQWIVFHCRHENEDHVLKIPNTPHLGWSIHEIPPDLSATRLYDVGRLNAKLLRLVGNELIDDMCEAYNDVYAAVLRMLHTSGLEGLARFANDDRDLLQSFAFILHTPGMRRRLEDLALLDLSHHQPHEIVLVNEMSGLIEDTRENIVTWAKQMSITIDRGVVAPKHLAPSRLPANPLFVWGGAVLDGFFTDQEMADALAFIAAHFGRLTGRDDAMVLGEQVFALMALLGCVSDPEKIRRFVRFCAMAGFRFVDEHGNEIPAERVIPDRAKPSTTQGQSPLTPRIPKLAPPSSVPPFAEEGRADPLGQSETLLRKARERIGTFIGEHSRISHARGIAVSLPRALVIPEWEWTPWRRTISVDAEEPSTGSQPASPGERVEQVLNVPVLLRLLQRCLVSLSTPDCSQPEERWVALAKAVEDFGYLALCQEFDVTTRPRLNAAFEVGKIAARLHAHKTIHGDLRLDDLKFDEHGKLTGMYDLGRAAILDRELTTMERACDLAVLKRHSAFLAWEAVKLGYRSEAPQVAEAVFACFPSAADHEVV